MKNKDVKAIIIAAGKGSRLRPFTNHLPKGLLKIGKEYPIPIVIHEKARQKALSAFKKI